MQDLCRWGLAGLDKGTQIVRVANTFLSDRTSLLNVHTKSRGVWLGIIDSSTLLLHTASWMKMHEQPLRLGRTCCPLQASAFRCFNRPCFLSVPQPMPWPPKLLLDWVDLPFFPMANQHGFNLAFLWMKPSPSYPGWEMICRSTFQRGSCLPNLR